MGVILEHKTEVNIYMDSTVFRNSNQKKKIHPQIEKKIKKIIHRRIYETLEKISCRRRRGCD